MPRRSPTRPGVANFSSNTSISTSALKQPNFRSVQHQISRRECRGPGQSAHLPMVKSVLRTESACCRVLVTEDIRTVTLVVSACRRAGVFGCERTDCRPVELVASLGEEAEEAVAQEAGNRHRHAQVLRGGEHEPN